MTDSTADSEAYIAKTLKFVNNQLEGVPFLDRKLLALSVITSSLPISGSNEERALFLADIVSVFDAYKLFQKDVLHENGDVHVH